MTRKNMATCPYCSSVFHLHSVTEESPDTAAVFGMAKNGDIPIESQKPPFKSPGYIDSLKARIAELEITVQRACNLLNDCLEWDNGGERAYEKIVEFINKHDRDVGWVP